MNWKDFCDKSYKYLLTLLPDSLKESDLDKNVDGRTYYFDTLSSVPVTDINLHYNFVKYDDKNLVFSYKLGKLVGYDKIRYKMYKLTYNQETGVQDKELLDKNGFYADLYNSQFDTLS